MRCTGLIFRVPLTRQLGPPVKEFLQPFVLVFALAPRRIVLIIVVPEKLLFAVPFLLVPAG